MVSLAFPVLSHSLEILALCCLAHAVALALPQFFGRITKGLKIITSPALWLVGIITPAIVPKWLHTLLAAFWIWALHLALYLAAGAYGFLPSVTPT